MNRRELLKFGAASTAAALVPAGAVAAAAAPAAATIAELTGTYRVRIDYVVYFWDEATAGFVRAPLIEDVPKSALIRVEPRFTIVYDP